MTVRTAAARQSRRMLVAALALTSLACVLSPGCSTTQPILAPSEKPAYHYVVGSGDLLAIEVFGEKDLQKEVTVGPDGGISFPLVGPVNVAGRTIQQVAELVAAALVRTGRFADPSFVNLTVTLRQSRSAQVQVFGEVVKQGAIPYHAMLSVTEALSATGGTNWTTAKIEDVRIIRGSLDDPTVIEVDLEHVFEGNSKNVFLAPGDIVLVPPKYVTRWDRYLSQLLNPVGTAVGVGVNAGAIATIGN